MPILDTFKSEEVARAKTPPDCWYCGTRTRPRATQVPTSSETIWSLYECPSCECGQDRHEAPPVR